VRRGLPFALLAPLFPSAASACTWCVSSAFGDRTFSWPYLGLLVAPFMIGSTIAAVLWLSLLRMGGLERAPRAPKRSADPGAPGARLDSVGDWAAEAPISAKRLPSSALDKEMT
jgi:hypothetical protein